MIIVGDSTGSAAINIERQELGAATHPKGGHMQRRSVFSTVIVAFVITWSRPHLIHAQGHATGLVFSDPAAYQVLPLASPALTGTFPRSFDLSASFPPAGDQGEQGSCVGWAVSYLKAYQEQIKRHWNVSDLRHQFSPAYIYNQIKQPGSCLLGTMYEKAFDLMRNKGIAPLSEFPYDAAVCAERPADGSPVSQTAGDYKILKWYRVDISDLDDIKSYLLAGYPVLIGMMVDNEFQALRGDAVYRRAPAAISAGGHAMVVVGYDDSKGAVRVLNSWGRYWGDQGLGWIAYESLPVAVRQAYVVEDSFSAMLDAPPSSNDAAARSPTVVVFGGQREFLGDVTVKAKRIVFSQGSTIRVRNGSTLELLADEIIVEGAALIDGTGEPGASGLDGGSYPGSEWVSRGDADYWSARHEVEAKSNHPDRGRPGGNGEKGGRGARIVMSHKAIGGSLEFRLDGGPGGSPGRGGHGRLLKNGRQFYCNGCMFEQPGHDGKPGPKGEAGQVVYNNP